MYMLFSQIEYVYTFNASMPVLCASSAFANHPDELKPRSVHSVRTPFGPWNVKETSVRGLGRGL
jgi:hypothetical protein